MSRHTIMFTRHYILPSLRRLIALLLAFAFVATACTGDDDNPDEDDTETTESTNGGTTPESEAREVACGEEMELEFTVPQGAGEVYACVDRETRDLVCMSVFDDGTVILTKDPASIDDLNPYWRDPPDESDVDSEDPDMLDRVRAANLLAQLDPPAPDLQEDELGLGLVAVEIDLQSVGAYDPMDVVTRAEMNGIPPFFLWRLLAQAVGETTETVVMGIELAQRLETDSGGQIVILPAGKPRFETIPVDRFGGDVRLIQTDMPPEELKELLRSLDLETLAAALPLAVLDGSEAGVETIVILGEDPEDPESVEQAAELVYEVAESTSYTWIDLTSGTNVSTALVEIAPDLMEIGTPDADFLIVEVEVWFEGADLRFLFDGISVAQPTYTSVTSLADNVEGVHLNLIGYFHPIVRGHPIDSPQQTQDEPSEAADAQAGNGVNVVVLDTGHPEDWPDTDAYTVRNTTTGPRNKMPGGSIEGHGPFIAELIKRQVPAATVILHPLARIKERTATTEDTRIDETTGSTEDVKVEVFEERDLIANISSIADSAEENRRLVLNASLGLYGCPDAYPLALARALENAKAEAPELIVVASAGNDETSAPVFPAAFATDTEYADWIVSVGSIADDPVSDGAAEHSCFSNYGPWVEYWVDGEGVVSRFSFNPGSSTMARWSGTSFAAPQIAAAIAAGTIDPTETPSSRANTGIFAGFDTSEHPKDETDNEVTNNQSRCSIEGNN